MSEFLPGRIVSGGQTGVDRGALRAAQRLGIPHGGWCPLGRLAEDGPVPAEFDLREMPTADYAARTRQNVIDSDATLILSPEPLSGGTRLTWEMARQAGRPVAIYDPDNPETPDRLRLWLAEVRPAVLNVAGPRESLQPGIERQSQLILLTTFRRSRPFPRPG